MNPWEEIRIDEYEKHMSLKTVYQLQTLNSIMKEQLHSDFPAIMILGIAAGNGLEHIDPDKTALVYGVDINQEYLDQCKIRFPALTCLKTICCDLTEDENKLPSADLLVADLLIEYIGYEHFQKVVQGVHAKQVSCVIQVNTDNTFVSDSPYLHSFDKLSEIHHQVDVAGLIAAMECINYKLKSIDRYDLPNGKQLIRLDFLA